MTVLLFCSPCRWNTNKTDLPPLFFFLLISIKCSSDYINSMGNPQTNSKLTSQKTRGSPLILLDKAPSERLHQDTARTRQSIKVGEMLAFRHAKYKAGFLLYSCTFYSLAIISRYRNNNHMPFFLLYLGQEGRKS